MNPVQLVSLKVIVVNVKTKREWPTTLDGNELASGLLNKINVTFNDHHTRKVDAILHAGRSSVMVEGRPFVIEYEVTYSPHYGNGMFAQTELVSRPYSGWLVKLVPVFNVSVDADYPVAI